jgi:hypothetical protein
MLVFGTGAVCLFWQNAPTARLCFRIELGVSSQHLSTTPVAMVYTVYTQTQEEQAM